MTRTECLADAELQGGKAEFFMPDDPRPGDPDYPKAKPKRRKAVKKEVWRRWEP
jgi:hypothetical protein